MNKYACCAVALVVLGVIGCSSGTSSSTAPTSQPPVANAGGPYTGTAGVAVSLSGSGSNDPQNQALTYAWNFGDSTSGTGGNPSHIYSTAGTYTVSLTVTDTSNLRATATAKATISAASRPPVANAGGPYTGTAGAAVSLSGTGSTDPQGQTLTYAWNFGDSTTGTGVSPSHAYSTAGTYTVSLTVTDTSNLSATATSKATISGPPQIQSIAVTPANTSISAEMTLQYTATATFSDGSTQNVSDSATWESSNASIATISNVSGTQGLVSSAAAGKSTISAALEGTTGSTGLTVTAAPTTTGSWSGGLNSNSGNMSFFTANLIQLGTNLSGQIAVSGNTAFDPTTSFPVTGTVSSTGQVELSGTQTTSTLTFSGSTSVDLTTATGSYGMTNSSGSVLEQGNATALHPPAVAGSTYAGTFVGGDNGTTTFALDFAPATTTIGSVTNVTGTGNVNGLQVTCGVSPAYVFNGTQTGLNITGSLSQNGAVWAQLGGYLNSDGALLSGHAVLTQGNCSGMPVDGTLNGPPGGVVFPTGDTGPVTVTVRNFLDGTGQVLVNGFPVSCPAAPPGAYKIPGFPGLVCGTVSLPAGTSAIQYDVFADPGNGVGPRGPCGVGGSTNYLTTWTCNWPLYNIPDSGAQITFQIEFGPVPTT
jgi:PKD repeat protein